MADTYVAHQVEVNNVDRFTPTSPEFGAVGDASSDDTAEVNACVAAIPTGGTLVLDDFFKVAGAVDISKTIHIVGRGGLVVADGSNLVRVLRITGDRSSIDGILIDQSAVTGNTNDGIGLQVGGADSRIRGVRVIGENSVGGNLSNGIQVSGSRIDVVSCHVKDPGYAGFLNSGDGNRYRGCSTRTQSRTDNARGFVDNSTSSKILTIDNCHFDIDSSDAGAVGINLNPTTLTNARLINTYARCTNGNNSVKLQDVAKVVIQGCTLDTGPLGFASGVTECIVRDTDFQSAKIDFGASQVARLYLHNVTMAVAGSYCLSQAIIGRLLVRDSYFSGFTGAWLDNDQAWANWERVQIENSEFYGNSASNTYLWNDGSGTLLGTGKIVVLGSTVGNNGAGGSDFHANSDKAKYFKTLDGSGRVFYGNAAPTGGTWAAGDQVIDINSPAAGGTIGWVCVSAGSPGSWKTFGSVAA